MIYYEDNGSITQSDQITKDQLPDGAVILSESEFFARMEKSNRERDIQVDSILKGIQSEKEEKSLITIAGILNITPEQALEIRNSLV